MKRYLIAAISTLVLSATVTEVAKAETVTATPKAINSSATVIQTNPFNLVRLAYQGQFRDAGIPGYGALISAAQFGDVTAEDIVKSAIAQNRVSADKLSDRSFLSAVEAQLRDLQTSSRG